MAAGGETTGAVARDDPVARRPAAPAGWARLGERLRSDHLVRNSLYLILSSGLQAALGFVFWVVVAHVFSTRDVGRASGLIAATTVIAYLALLGLNTAMVRYLPTAEDRDTLITTGLTLVAACGAVMAAVFVVLTPSVAPRLAFVEHHWALAVGFVLLTAAASANLMTDSVFIGSRRAGLCALTDGAVGGTSKIVAAVLLAGVGSYGIFVASAGGFAASAIVSVILILALLGWRPRFDRPLGVLRPLGRFSAANYFGNVLSLLPVLVVPLVVLDRLGARPAAWYFVAFQIATLLYAVAYAVCQSFLAEGSHEGADQRQLRRRSARVLAVLYVPAVVVIGLAAHWILEVFGARYSQHGAPALALLALAAVPVAACNWLWTLLRLSSRLGAIVLSSGVYTVAICGLAWVLAPHGLTAVAAAWPIGALAAAVVATAAASLSRTNSAVGSGGAAPVAAGAAGAGPGVTGEHGEFRSR